MARVRWVRRRGEGSRVWGQLGFRFGSSVLGRIAWARLGLGALGLIVRLGRCVRFLGQAGHRQRSWVLHVVFGPITLVG